MKTKLITSPNVGSNPTLAIMNTEIIEAVKDLDFSNRFAITHDQFMAILNTRSQTGKGVNLLAKLYGIKPATLNNMLASIPEAKELWTIANEEFLDKFNGSAQRAIEEILDDVEHPDRFKAAKFILEKTNDNFKKESTGNVIADKAVVIFVKDQGEAIQIGEKL